MSRAALRPIAGAIRLEPSTAACAAGDGDFEALRQRCASSTSTTTKAALWFRAYGNENWEFREDGLMLRRYASINDLPISESERRLR